MGIGVSSTHERNIERRQQVYPFLRFRSVDFLLAAGGSVYISEAGSVISEFIIGDKPYLSWCLETSLSPGVTLEILIANNDASSFTNWKSFPIVYGTINTHDKIYVPAFKCKFYLKNGYSGAGTQQVTGHIKMEGL